MARLAAAYFPNRISNKAYGIDWPAHSVSLIPYSKQDEALMKLIDAKVINVLPIDNFFSDFHYNNGGKKVFTHIGNGIGDIFAFSAVAQYLADYPLQVHVTKRFHPIFDWFKRSDIVLKEYFESIVNDFTPANRLIKYKHLHRIVIENAAVEAGTGNWFDAHFKRIGLETSPEGYDRPQLKTERISNQKSNLVKKSILLCHKSSCQMRSSNIEDFYIPAIKAFPNHKIYVHESDLIESDYDYIKQSGIQIAVLPKCSISDFLLNVYDAGIVISTDSSALHFREGTERRAVGVYGAMLQDSRTRGYKFVKPFDVKTGCQYQPCVIHEKIKGEVCKNAEPGDRFARCQSGKLFQEQLYQELIKL